MRRAALAVAPAPTAQPHRARAVLHRPQARSAGRARTRSPTTYLVREAKAAAPAPAARRRPAIPAAQFRQPSRLVVQAGMPQLRVGWAQMAAMLPRRASRPRPEASAGRHRVRERPAALGAVRTQALQGAPPLRAARQGQAAQAAQPHRQPLWEARGVPAAASITAPAGLAAGPAPTASQKVDSAARLRLRPLPEGPAALEEEGTVTAGALAEQPALVDTLWSSSQGFLKTQLKQFCSILLRKEAPPKSRAMSKGSSEIGQTRLAKKFVLYLDRLVLNGERSSTCS